MSMVRRALCRLSPKVDILRTGRRWLAQTVSLFDTAVCSYHNERRRHSILASRTTFHDANVFNGQRHHRHRVHRHLSSAASTTNDDNHRNTNNYLNPLIICGPSGAGKSTLIKNFLLKDPLYGAHFGFSVSHTTRAPRDGEENGVHYHFVDEEEFRRLSTRNNNENDEATTTTTTTSSSSSFFLETAFVHGNWYGTSFEAVRAVQRQNLICLLDVDIQGVKTIHHNTRGRNSNSICSSGDNGDDDDSLVMNSFFMTPPLELLSQRLRERGSESPESLALRLQHAEEEVEEAMFDAERHSSTDYDSDGNENDQRLFDAVIVAETTAEVFEILRPKLAEWYPTFGE